MHAPEQVRQLNDAFRKTLIGGRVVITQGVLALNDTERILGRVQQFDDFNEDNNPTLENDFGAFQYAGHNIFWKVDYYSLDLEAGSPNPADPFVTTRVLTVMMAEEY